MLQGYAEQVTIAPIAAALAPIPGLVRQQEALAKVGPTAASSAFRASRTKLGRYSWDLTVASLGAATDHLTALDGLVGAPQRPAWAYFTLMRSALESACLARWLCESRIKPSERLGRGVAAQIADFSERAKVERFMTPPPTVPVASQIAGLQVAYARLRYPRLPPVPSLTQLVNHYAVPGGNCEMLYRVLSGAAHGKQWAMLPMGQFTASPVSGPRRSTHVAGITVNAQLVAMFATITVRAVARAIGDAQRYSGH
jgi:hypothetical protein